jgi:hypothetical protein
MLNLYWMEATLYWDHVQFGDLHWTGDHYKFTWINGKCNYETLILDSKLTRQQAQEQVIEQLKKDGELCRVQRMSKMC